MRERVDRVSIQHTHHRHCDDAQSGANGIFFSVLLPPEKETQNSRTLILVHIGHSEYIYKYIFSEQSKFSDSVGAENREKKEIHPEIHPLQPPVKCSLSPPRPRDSTPHTYISAGRPTSTSSSNSTTKKSADRLLASDRKHS